MELNLFALLRRRGRGTRGPSTDADTVLRLAVLLRTGIDPASAWRYLADTGSDVAQTVVDRVAAGGEVAEALDACGDPWGEVGAAWAVATTVGAPLADSLRAMSIALQDAAATRDEVSVALAEPAGTARLMTWLPLVAVLMGAALGFDPVRVMITNPLGIACVVGGVVLLGVAHRWTTSLVRRAQPLPGIPGFHAELTAIAVTGGVSLERAQALVRQVGGGEPDTETAGILALSRSAGVPAAELLRAASGIARHRARTEGRLRAAALSSRLLLPLGVCILPAFLLLGVAPMLLSVLASTSLTL